MQQLDFVCVRLLLGTFVSSPTGTEDLHAVKKHFKTMNPEFTSILVSTCSNSFHIVRTYLTSVLRLSWTLI